VGGIRLFCARFLGPPGLSDAEVGGVGGVGCGDCGIALREKERERKRERERGERERFVEYFFGESDIVVRPKEEALYWWWSWEVGSGREEAEEVCVRGRYKLFSKGCC
jgi:hypothetical protein